MAIALAIYIFSILAAPPQIEFKGVSPELINGLGLTSPQCLAANPVREEFLVADALNDRIVIFDTTATAVFDFPLGDGRHNPFGIAVNSNEEILISPMDLHEIWIYDYGGRYLATIPLPENVFPGRIIIDSSDAIYVVDRGGAGFLELNKSGEIIRQFSSDSSPCKPSGLCRRGNDLMLVSVEGNTIIIFGPDAKIKGTLGMHGRRLEDFSHPVSALVDKEGNLWVLDSFRHHIKRFDSRLKFVDIVGQRGNKAGEFYFPSDLTLTPGGKLGVLEKGSGRLQVFRLKNEK